jgi:hypothetical protein
MHHFHKQSVVGVQLYLFLVPLEQELGWVQTYTNEENYNYWTRGLGRVGSSCNIY